jgi:uncharacterized protein
VSGREPAWRLLAQELNASVEEEKGVGERAASYLLSPLGARMNRVLVAGTLGPPESIGRDPDNPFFRAPLEDPTGAVSVTAGTFQPRAMSVLRTITAPTPVVVVGKTHLFRGRDGTAYVSVRAETVRAISPDEVREHWADAVEQTQERIRLRKGTGGSASGSPSRVPAHWKSAADLSRIRYPSADLEAYHGPLARTWEAVAGTLPLPSPAAGPTSRAVAPLPNPVRITRAVAPAPPAAPTASERAEESAFLDVIDQIAEGSADGYADVHEVVRAAARTGVTSHRAEELLGRLEEAGSVEEPIVGKLRRA